MHAALADLLVEEPPDDLTPEAIAERLFEILQNATDTRCAVAHETVQIGRQLVFAEVQSTGDAGFRAASSALEGRSLFRYVGPMDAPSEEAWPGELNPAGRFGVARRRAVRGLGAWDMYWKPARLRSTLGMTIAHDGYLVGAIACARLLGEPAFGRAEIAAARTLEGGIRRWFVAAWRRRLAQCRSPGSRSYLVFDGGGRLISISKDASRWLRRPSTLDHIQGLVARAIDGQPPSRAFVRRAPLTLERLDGGGVLAIVEEGDHHRSGPREKLTDAQRRVADLAVAGATVKEIAAGLERSPETVRDHLKAIYDRLGIGSRVELGRVLDPPPPRRPALANERARWR